MKHFIICQRILTLHCHCSGKRNHHNEKDQKDKVSYSIGMKYRIQLSKQKVDINPDILAAGIKDAIAGKPQLTQTKSRSHGAI